MVCSRAHRAVVTAAIGLIAFVASGELLAGEMTRQQLSFFESKIRPALLKHCADCHSSETETLEGNFSIDTRAAVRSGGDSGAAVVPGKPDQSLLLDAIAYDGLFYDMPPSGKLPDAVIADFRKWIEMGAPDPRDGEAKTKSGGIDLEAGRKFWAFQPVDRPTTPDVDAEDWPLDEIDRFILAKQEAAGLTPVADADRRTWLRRVTLDLTGLTPTIPEIESFLQDESPQAFDCVVDRLLASQQFGERWGRHWLDLARYADSTGTARYIVLDEAWRYRDYVIESFNDDKPYDQFVREQIAGDILPSDSTEQGAEQIVATGFLALGAWPVIANDMNQLRADIIDFQVDKTGRAMMGLTLGCARCHDHKFDPIPQDDYYGIAGILNNTMTSSGRIGATFFSEWIERQLPETPQQAAERESREKDFQRQLGELENRRSSLKAEQKRLGALRQQLESGGPVEAPRFGLPMTVARIAQRQAVIGAEISRINDDHRYLRETHSEPGPPRAVVVQDRSPSEIGDMQITVRGNAHQLGKAVPRGLITVALQNDPPQMPSTSSGRLELADFIASPDNPLTARVMVNRIWHHLMGRGIVASVDNFGLNGDRPTHPELLDYLAAEFVANDWSVKSIVRQVALSRTYRLSAAPDAAGLAVDPDNKLRWRMDRRRLDVDAMRDSILQISGRLDPTYLGKTAMTPYNKISSRAGNRRDQISTADAEPSERILRRRTVYLPLYRRGFRGEMEMLPVFDFPELGMVVGDRSETIVPTQALYLLNGPFILKQARATAETLLKDRSTVKERVDTLYQEAYGRPATEEEVGDARDFLTELATSLENAGRLSEEARRIAWARLCQTVFASNEFLFRG
ncbi:PSD1 and planctomycete cytochrome C domain-containing protein [Stratiformator vulcanicus]|uniref:Planctomycete cytochrome C n=1 Tax=Stratiformator vulcanicus TaxID=2527980 RepID=A0A517R553_9PLAN|nr:PSD1 and planctomycete cytochrome C domain-containing protein [Stratiformator vulcanicus]QDT39027.1 Planctomycete cytochrome C [Stratiformator vulcanicus]